MHGAQRMISGWELSTLYAQQYRREDFLLRAGRKLMYAGLAFSSLLVIRVGPLTVGDLLIASSFVVSLLAIVKPPLPKHFLPFGTVGILILGGLFTCVASMSPDQSLLVLARILFLVAALPALLALLLQNERTIINAARAFAFGAAACGAGTLLQYFIGPAVIPGADITTAGRFSGFTAHVSDTGGITALGVVYCVAMFGSKVDKGKGLLTFVIFAGSVVGLVLSGSVSGMLAAVAGSLLALILRGLSFRQIIMLSLGGGLSTYLASMILSNTQTALNPVERLLQVFGVTATRQSLNTSDSRWETIVEGWEGFLANPFAGVGLEEKASYVIGALPVHNLFVAALYQGGLIFSLALFGVLIFIFGKASRKVRRSEVSIAIYALAMTALAFSLTAPSLYNRYFWIPVALLAVSRVVPPAIIAGATAQEPPRIWTAGSAAPIRGSQSEEATRL